MEPNQSSSRGFSGTVNLQLTDLIQMVCLSRSDLTVCVRSGKGSGTIYIREGEIYHAETEIHQGEAGFFEMLCWNDGQFEMLPFIDRGIKSMDRSWEYLLLEAMRRRDEEASEQMTREGVENVGEEHPPPSSPVEMDENIDLAFETFRIAAGGPAPVKDQHRKESGNETVNQIHPNRALRVLVVDDSPFFAGQLKRMLEADADIQVVARAGNGREAVDFLASNPSIDLITLDAQMPVMPGDSALKHIMIRFGIPVVIVSSFHTQSLNDVFEFLQLGAVDFVTKPDAKEDISLYGELLRDRVKRASRAHVAHFRRWRKSKSDSKLKMAGPDRAAKRILVIVGAEGAYLDWFRLPLQHLCGKGLVIGLQKLSDLLLPGFCKLIEERSQSRTAPLMNSEWIFPGAFHFGNASHRVRLNLIPEEMDLGIELLPSETLAWHEGARSWVAQLAEQAGSRMSLYFLSAAHSLPADFVEHLLRCNVQMIMPPLDTVMCTDLVESIVPYSRSFAGQIVWASPENLMEVWLDYDLSK